MKKLPKLLGSLGAAALAAGMTPYRVQSDKETGAFEVSSLLWSLKKIPGEEKDRYVFELLPLVGDKEKPAAEAEPEEAPAE